jgi:hypothetical protein
MKIDNKGVVGLYVAEDLISVAKFKLLGTVVTPVSCAFEKGNFDFKQKDFSQIIKSLFKKSNIIPENVFVCCDLPGLVLKEISLPLMESENIPEALTYEIEKHSPYDIDDIVSGYVEQSIQIDDSKKVLWVAAPQEYFEKFLNILKINNIKIKSAGLYPIAVSNYYSYINRDFLTESILLLDLNYLGKVVINIIDKGDLRFSKNTKVSLLGALEDADSWKIIYEEIEDALEYFETAQNGKKPLKLRLHNNPGLSKETKHLLYEKIQMDFVEIKHVVEPEYIVPLGLAMNAFNKGISLNLIKKSFIRKKHKVSLKKKIFKLSLCILFLVSSFYTEEMFFRFKIMLLNKKNQQNKQIVSEIIQVKNKVDKIEKDILLFKELEDLNLNFLRIFNEFYVFIPEGTILKHVKINASGKIKLSGITKNISKVLESLNNSTFLNGVSIDGQITRNKDYKGDFENFKITCYFSDKEARDER